ncbi:hypothetical protein [Kutzneria chonburiensis]|uniref:Uncharacterized protein n=1 Tax=Kutzneria chonburiensis TaxID=1483604 RepID=A0ABV6N4X9_9PSEU|nr:hypothetical protein [Kutzneria chonburiensis]
MTGGLALIASFWIALAVWFVWLVRSERARRGHVDQRRAEMSSWLPEPRRVPATDIIQRIELERDQYGRHSPAAVFGLIPTQRSAEADTEEIRLFSGKVFVPAAVLVEQEAS